MRTRTGVGIGVVGLALAPGVLVGAQARLAARRAYVEASEAPPVSGRFAPAPGVAPLPPVTLAVLGDSTGAGLGAEVTGDTVGGRLAAALAAAGHPVRLGGYAVSGARVAGLRPQVRALVAAQPSGVGLGEASGPVDGLASRLVVVVLIGVNDATHLTALRAVRDGLNEQLVTLRGLGAEVVLATCPDVGAARNFAQPLRLVAAWRARAVARTEKEAAADVPGVQTVDLAAETGAAFRADPRNLSRDLFHPSPAGYLLWAQALRPAVLRAASTPPGR